MDSDDGAPKDKRAAVGRVEIAVHGSRKVAKRSRPIIVVPKDGGELREVSHEDVLSGLVKKTATEIAHVDGRPEYVLCLDCRKPVATRAMGPVPSRCKRCTKRDRDPIRKHARRREWAKQNSDRVAASKKRSVQKKDPGALREERKRARDRYRSKNLDKDRERVSKWRAENPVAAAESARKSRARNKDECNERRRDRRRLDPEIAREKDRANYARYKEQRNEYMRAYRARKKAEREAAKKAGGSNG